MNLSFFLCHCQWQTNLVRVDAKSLCQQGFRMEMQGLGLILTGRAAMARHYDERLFGEKVPWALIVFLINIHVH